LLDHLLSFLKLSQIGLHLGLQPRNKSFVIIVFAPGLMLKELKLLIARINDLISQGLLIQSLIPVLLQIIMRLLPFLL
jgi:hypothetical protein